MSALRPIVGFGFILCEQARHKDNLRPLIGVTGSIRTLINGGSILHVVYPSGAEVHVAANLGIVTVPPSPEEVAVADVIAAEIPPRCYTVRLPLPPHCSSPNARVNRRYASPTLRDYRETCAQLFRDAKIPALRTPISVSLAYYLCRHKEPIPVFGHMYNPKWFAYPRDLDNARACAKAAQDALQDAGIILSDGAAYVRLGDTAIYSRKQDHKDLTCLDMTIREERA